MGTKHLTFKNAGDKIYDYEVVPLVNENSDVSKLDNVKLSKNV